jgi:hypothetical protein
MAVARERNAVKRKAGEVAAAVRLAAVAKTSASRKNARRMLKPGRPNAMLDRCAACVVAHTRAKNAQG